MSCTVFMSRGFCRSNSARSGFVRTSWSRHLGEYVRGFFRGNRRGNGALKIGQALWKKVVERLFVNRSNPLRELARLSSEKIRGLLRLAVIDERRGITRGEILEPCEVAWRGSAETRWLRDGAVDELS